MSGYLVVCDTPTCRRYRYLLWRQPCCPWCRGPVVEPESKEWQS